MPDNRIWIVHRPTGAFALIGKRYGGVAYLTDEGVMERIAAMFETAEAHVMQTPTGTGADDFVIVMESANDAPFATDLAIIDYASNRAEVFAPEPKQTLTQDQRKALRDRILDDLRQVRKPSP